ncbi:DUF3347 domain-containing protein [Arenibacter palladensis]|uniref:DUF3347 domain-containing protein n=1 Tax=Arenibacter palladensis TaxID=237373 RepID=UPI002FD0B168
MKTNVNLTLTIAAISLISFTSCKESKKEQNTDHENHTEMSHDNTDNNHNGAKMSATLDSDQNRNVEVILNDYLNLKDALVGDDNEKAKKIGTTLANSLGNLDVSKYSDSQKSELNDIIENAKEHAKHISESDIKHQREHFKTISKDVTNMVAITGTEKKLYEQFCPMYDKGTAWLSISKDIKNPYYGSQMLTCGKVQKEIN